MITARVIVDEIVETYRTHDLLDRRLADSRLYLCLDRRYESQNIYKWVVWTVLGEELLWSWEFQVTPIEVSDIPTMGPVVEQMYSAILEEYRKEVDRL